MNDTVELFTVGMLCATSYTCFSVAGFVPSFVAELVLLGRTGSAVNVFTQLIVCADVLSTRLLKSTMSAIGSHAVPFQTTFVQASNFGAVVCACTTLYISPLLGEAGKSAYVFTCH